MTKESTKLESESRRDKELRRAFPIGCKCERKRGSDDFLKLKYRSVGYKFSVKAYRYGDSIIDENGVIHKISNIRRVRESITNHKVVANES